MSSIKDFELAQRIYIATHELKTRIAELERERDALKQDAERYRWLRSNRRVGNAKLMMWATGQGRYDDVSQEDAMDAVIDAAKEKP